MARRQAAATSWALGWKPNCQRSSEHREGVEPSSPQYGCGVFASRPPVHVVLSVGPVGIEPTSSGLRDLCITLSATVPVPVVVLRIELSVTCSSDRSGPPALDYRFQSGTPESNREPPAPKAGVLPSAPLPACLQSERPDLNRRSPGPRPGAIPRLRHVLSPTARTPIAVGWEVLESSSPGFQPGATPSQLPTRTKKARRLL